MKRFLNSELAWILAVLGIDFQALLGQGGESLVFALDDERIARINRPGTSRAQVDSRTALLAELELTASKVPFAVPVVLDTIIIEGIIVTIERRLPGRTMIDLLAEAHGEARGLADYFSAVQNWIAAYWAFAADDASLHQWCRKILID